MSCALSFASGSLTSESQGNKLFLTSSPEATGESEDWRNRKMVKRGSSVSEDEPLLENWMNDLQGLYGWE